MDWKKVWDKKGKTKTTNLNQLDGFESVKVNTKDMARKISKALGIRKTDRILEVGCGAGMMAQHLNCNYVGTDYSKFLVKKHIEILKNSVLVAEANNIPFKDKYFDKVFSYSVFHYFPDKRYARKALNEMKRVCRGKIFIGDLPMTSHRKEHLLFKKDEFNGKISKGYYNKARFNVLLSPKTGKRG